MHGLLELRQTDRAMSRRNRSPFMFTTFSKDW